MMWFAIFILHAQLAAADPIVVDGDLSEPQWKLATEQPFAPALEGVPATGGDVRVLVRGGYIYLGLVLPETDSRFSARSIGRNPHWEEEEDMVRIIAGAYPDFEVKVGPLGAYSIGTKGVVIENPRFFASARTGDRRWTAEIAIPLHDLKAARLSEIRLTAERLRAARPGVPELRWRWPAQGVARALPPGETDAPPPVFKPAWIGNQDPPLQVSRSSPLPSPSTVWDDDGWRAVPSWTLIRNEPVPRRADHATSVKALHDGNRLSVFARMDDAEPRESFEIFLATTGSAYLWFTLDSQGALEDYSGFSGGQRIARPRQEWISGAQGVARKEGRAWLARIDIPLDTAAQALGEPPSQKSWRILLVRRRPGETTVLPVIGSDTFTAPARYRALTLVDRATTTSAADLPAPTDIRVLSNQRDMLQRHVRNRVGTILKDERQQWDKVITRADWEKFRDTRIQALKASIGEFPARVPLRVQVSREFPGEGYRRQNLVYQSRPGFWVTANLYLPSKAVARMPAIVIIHSHHRPRTQAELQDMGILWARAGAAVLIPDQIGAGERLQNYPWNREAYHSRYILGMQLHLIGESLIGWMVWDTVRGVDLLLERSDVDPNRVILLGAVAGGGDPAAVTAALDSRIAAVVPYNFGESTPENPRFMPEKNRWPHELADPGSGSWETTRGLRGSIAGQFLPWLICASVAPRKFVYSFEMGWNVEDLPAWKRYRKVFSLFDALDNLDESHGFGPFPGPGECTNIGPAQRKTLYPELQRWFGIAPPEKEPEDRRPESELLTLTPALAAKLDMQPVHKLAQQIARDRLSDSRAAMSRTSTPEQRLEWLRRALKPKLGDIDPSASVQQTSVWKKTILGFDGEGIALDTEPGITLPFVLLRPSAKPKAVVVVVAQSGKDRVLCNRRTEIEALLKQNIAVALIDVRGTGETAPDSRRSPLSSGISLSATEQMLGGTLIGGQLKDLRSVVRHLAARPDLKGSKVALWGDSHSPVNPDKFVLDELPNWQVGPQIQHQSEPLGGLLAALCALYEPTAGPVAIYRGLASYQSLLEDRFAYVPADAVVPGFLEVADLDDVYKAIAARPVLLAETVDARNRRVGAAGNPSDWLIKQLSNP